MPSKLIENALKGDATALHILTNQILKQNLLADDIIQIIRPNKDNNIYHIYLLGVLTFTGAQGYPQDQDTAITLFKSALGRNNSYIKCGLAYAYMKHNIKTNKADYGMQLMKQAANELNPLAMLYCILDSSENFNAYLPMFATYFSQLHPDDQQDAHVRIMKILENDEYSVKGVKVVIDFYKAIGDKSALCDLYYILVNKDPAYEDILLQELGLTSYSNIKFYLEGVKTHIQSIENVVVHKFKPEESSSKPQYEQLIRLDSLEKSINKKLMACQLAINAMPKLTDDNTKRIELTELYNELKIRQGILVDRLKEAKSSHLEKFFPDASEKVRQLLKK
jgi:hypothetical protein